VKAGCGKTARPVCAADGGQRESNRARLLRPDIHARAAPSPTQPAARCRVPFSNICAITPKLCTRSSLAIVEDRRP
jgi:hypothetical protein